MIYYKLLDKSKTIYDIVLNALNDINSSLYTFENIGISFLVTDIISGLEDTPYFY